MEEKIQARLILEILGRPASNVTEALNTILDRMSKEKGVRILEKKVHDPVAVKDVQDLFTSFAEVMVECETLFGFLGMIFTYMPSNVEVVRPDHIQLRNEELAMMSNQILTRLHNYDAIARRLIVDNSLLKQKLGISELPQQTQDKMKQVEQKQEIKPEEKKESKKKNKSRKKKK